MKISNSKSSAYKPVRPAMFLGIFIDLGAVGSGVFTLAEPRPSRPYMITNLYKRLRNAAPHYFRMTFFGWSTFIFGIFSSIWGP